MKQIVFLYPNSSKRLKLYEDLKNIKEVELVSIQKCVSSLKIQTNKNTSILKLVISKCKRTLLFCRSFVYNYKYFYLPNLCSKADILFVMDWALVEMDNLEILERCRNNNKNLKIYLYLINQIGSKDAELRKDVQTFKKMYNSYKWDKVFSFDKSDCAKYGLHYMGFNYYSMKNIKKVSNPTNDLFFVACYSSSREKMICDIYNYLTNLGVVCDFHIKLFKEGYDKIIDGVHYMTYGEKELLYENCLVKAQNSKCILEIIRPGQEAPTLRYMEAVCYNKKLLTNNSQITDYPYYNSEYMKCFEKVEDIDIDWLTDLKPVNYNYKGDFSPIKLIDYLRSIS